MTSPFRLARETFCGLLFLLLFLSSVPAVAQIYVKADATGAGNGTTWVDAFTDLQNAFAVASNGDTIWVAGGTYRPTTGTDRTVSFLLINGVALYGGFAGTETELGQRDIQSNPTILSGDIGVVDDNSDNSYHVVDGGGTDSTTVVDGFTITDGKANGTDPHNLGAGMYNDSGSPRITNVTFIDNTAYNGGGMFNRNGASPIMANVIFTGNAAQWGDVGHNPGYGWRQQPR